MHHPLACLLAALALSAQPIQAGVCPDYDTCMSRAMVLTATDLDFALYHYKEAFKLNPVDPISYAYLNILEAKLNGTQGTCPSYQACMAQGYSSAKLYQHREALTHFRRAIGFNPNNAEAQKAVSTVCRTILAGVNP